MIAYNKAEILFQRCCGSCKELDSRQPATSFSAYQITTLKTLQWVLAWVQMSIWFTKLATLKKFRIICTFHTKGRSPTKSRQGSTVCTVYMIRTVSFKRLLSALPTWLEPVCRLLQKINKQPATISTQTSQEGIKCTKAKDYPWSYYPNIYTVTGRLLEIHQSLYCQHF